MPDSKVVIVLAISTQNFPQFVERMGHLCGTEALWSVDRSGYHTPDLQQRLQSSKRLSILLPIKQSDLGPQCINEEGYNVLSTVRLINSQ